MRLILNVPYKDRTNTSVLLSKTGLLSVNQLAASIKLCEVWKSENVENYPVKLEPNNPGQTMNERTLRPSTIRKWNQDAKSTAAKESFSRNAAKLWNLAPLAIKSAKSLSLAKKKLINTVELCLFEYKTLCVSTKTSIPTNSSYSKTGDRLISQIIRSQYRYTTKRGGGGRKKTLHVLHMDITSFVPLLSCKRAKTTLTENIDIAFLSLSICFYFACFTLLHACARQTVPTSSFGSIPMLEVVVCCLVSIPSPRYQS